MQIAMKHIILRPYTAFQIDTIHLCKLYANATTLVLYAHLFSDKTIITRINLGILVQKHTATTELVNLDT